MRLPSYPQDGKPVADTVRQLIDYARASKLTGFVGGRVVETANGTMIVAEKTRPGRGGGGYNHPFKISVRTEGSPAEIRLYINAGRATALQWQDTESFPNFREVGVSFGAGGDLENDDWGTYATVGYEVLAASTTYGVWAVFTVSGSSVSNPSLSPEFPDIATTLVSGSGTILVTDDYPDPDDASALAVFLDSGSSPVYLGNVAIDGDGAATIKQYRKSDIVIPMTTLPAGLVWVGTNDIYIGSGGGLVVDP